MPGARTPQLLKPTRCRARVLQLLSLSAATTEACMPRAHALQQEKPPQQEAHAPQRRVTSHSPQLDKARAQQRRPNAAKQTKKRNK